ncbi:MAG: hypothetical protein HOD11_15465 [Candidatus Marinimicrobia bacterium]|nr:hypothetical protein [Candidatus Neomarinimicrobiota bacterium]MBT5270066.1 hypothetical protein [Candidatus Neomarinimicrobiota bacterium]
MKKKIIIPLVIVVILIIISTQITLFVIQPIGALPEGKTLVILRLNKTNFIDSADAMCERTAGKVSLLGRSMMLSAVMENSVVLLRLPYSEFLYLKSTGGAKYSG